MDIVLYYAPITCALAPYITLTEAGAKFEIISYPGAKHAFTNPDADKTGMAALAYNAEADQKSWAALLAFLKDVFGS